MDFSFTDEQQELKRQARSWLAERFPLDRDWDGPQDDAWGELAELGWLGVSVSEEEGGAGLGFLEEAILFEELGYALYPGPYLETIGLALPWLGADERRSVAAGETLWSVEVGGLVPHLATVDRVVADGSAYDAHGEMEASVDATRPMGRLERRERLAAPGRRGRVAGTGGDGVRGGRRRAARARPRHRARKDARAIRQADRRLPGDLARSSRTRTATSSWRDRSRTGRPGASPRATTRRRSRPRRRRRSRRTRR